MDYFFIALLLSFLGTLPPGLISLSILQRTLEGHREAGLIMALGACIPEFFYTYLALYGLEFFQQNWAANQYIQKISIVLFMLLGFYFLFKKTQVPTSMKLSYKSVGLDFISGILVGLMNMLIIPFWIFVAIWLKSKGLGFSSIVQLFVFSIGAALGAYIAFLGYIILGQFILKRIEKVALYSNKIIGLIFIGLAIFQCF